MSALCPPGCDLVGCDPPDAPGLYGGQFAQGKASCLCPCLCECMWQWSGFDQEWFLFTPSCEECCGDPESLKPLQPGEFDGQIIENCCDPPPMMSAAPAEKSRGFGDTVAKFTKASGIERVVKGVYKVLGKPCGCAERQAKLNEMFPYGKGK